MEVEDPHLRSRGFLGLVFSFIIYITIFLFGSQVMRGVLEEKTNRIVEVLISSVKPFQLLMGKIIGVGMVGLTQFVLWIALFGIFILAGSAILSTTVSPEALAAYVENGSAVSSNATTDLAMEQLGMGDFYSSFISMNWPLTLTCFLFYFIGAYLLYGSLLAAVGAAVDAEADSQQFMMPITIPLIAAIALAQLVIVNPESSIARIFSIFPLTSPIIMLVRVAMKSFEWWELILSMLLLVATFIGSVWVAGRIYRTGILMYGKKASWKELYKWLRH